MAAWRAVGLCYLVGNALGEPAVTGRAWAYRVVLAVDATRAAGVVAGLVPPVVPQASIDRYGPAGTLPTPVVDGGAARLVLVPLAFAAGYRGPWARGGQRRWVVAAR